MIGFKLTDEELKKFGEWRDEHEKTCKLVLPENQTAIGGRLTFSFTPTSLANVVKIECACGVKIDITDYESW